jgi:Arm DNA-binding domain
MPRQQFPPQIKRLEVRDRRTGKTVVRYQLTFDSGVNPQTGKRQQVRRRYATEKQARDALSEIGQQAATDQFVPRRAVTVDELCADWLASLHNARATTLNDYRYAVAPLRERHGDMPVQRLTRPDLDRLLTDLRDGGTTTAKGHARRPWSPRSLNKAVDAWRAALAYGIERRELGRNVSAAMKKVARTHQEMSTYTPDEIPRVLRAADKSSGNSTTTVSCAAAKPTSTTSPSPKPNGASSVPDPTANADQDTTSPCSDSIPRLARAPPRRLRP